MKERKEALKAKKETLKNLAGSKVATTMPPSAPSSVLLYSDKVKAIREAIRDGRRIYIETGVGSLLVVGINEDWVYTGEGFTHRSWRIASTRVDEWARELGII